MMAVLAWWSVQCLQFPKSSGQWGITLMVIQAVAQVNLKRLIEEFLGTNQPHHPAGISQYDMMYIVPISTKNQNPFLLLLLPLYVPGYEIQLKGNQTWHLCSAGLALTKPSNAVRPDECNQYIQPKFKRMPVVSTGVSTGKARSAKLNLPYW